MIVYKLPPTLSLDEVRALTGSDGSKLNPIQDADDNWVLSAEEMRAEEFNIFKIKYIDLIVDFKKIEYKPKKQQYDL